MILSRKQRVVMTYDCHKLLDEISRIMKSRVSTEPQDYWVSDHFDLHLEAQQTAQKSGIPFRPRVFSLMIWHLLFCYLFVKALI